MPFVIATLLLCTSIELMLKLKETVSLKVVLEGRLIKLCDVVLIAEALGVTPNDLYGIEEDKDAS